MRLSTLLLASQLPYPAASIFTLLKKGLTDDQLVSMGCSYRRMERVRSFLAEQSCQTVFYGMRGYPRQLYELENPPFRLMYRGDLPVDLGCAIHICGTRRCDDGAKKAAENFASEAAGKQAVLVVSNSQGIDRCVLNMCHKRDAYAIVVADCGLATSRILNDTDLKHATVLSPYEMEEPAEPKRCLSRNILSAALSRATVVIQAPLRSGALHCATSALDLGHEVYVHEVGTRQGEVNEGTRALVEMGSPVIRRYIDVAAAQGLTLYRTQGAWYHQSHG